MGQGSGVAVSHSIGCRLDFDLALLWLWRRPVTTDPIGPLAWEHPYAAGMALKRQKKFLNVQICVNTRYQNLWDAAKAVLREKFIAVNDYNFKKKKGSSRCGATETNPTCIHEDPGLIPGLAQ